MAGGHGRGLIAMNDDEGAPEPRGPFVVRRATMGDAEPIARVHTSAWQAAYLGILDDEYLAALDWHERAARWVDLLGRNDGATILVALVDAQVVAFATGGRSRDPEAVGDELYAIYVLPELWGRGLGSLLLERMISGFLASTPITLWVLEDNTPAIAFYSRHGFAPDGVSKLAHIGGRDVREIRLVRGAD